MVGRALEITFALIVAYLVLANADHFTKVIGALASAYGGSVKVLQGR